MKKRNDIKKEVKKIKKTENSKVSKRRNQREPDLWKEIRSNLKPLGKAYNKFKEKRRIAKQKEEERRLKEEEKQRLREEETRRLQEVEERRFKKEKKIKKEEERRLKEEEERTLKEEQRKLKEEQRKLKTEEERRLKEEEEQRIKEEEQRLKEEEIMNLKERRRPDDEQNKKRLNGTVKWFNDAKGFGFIKREDKEKDIFVHFSAVQNSGLKYLKEGDQLTFEVENTDKGFSAINLQKKSVPIHITLLKY